MGSRTRVVAAASLGVRALAPGGAATAAEEDRATNHVLRTVPGSLGDEHASGAELLDVGAPAGADAAMAARLEAGGQPRWDSFVNGAAQVDAGRARPTACHLAAALAVAVRAGGRAQFKGLDNREEDSADMDAGRVSAGGVSSDTHDVVVGPAALDLPEGTTGIVYAWGSNQDRNRARKARPLTGTRSAPSGAGAGADDEPGARTARAAGVVLPVPAGALTARRAVTRNRVRDRPDARIPAARYPGTGRTGRTGRPRNRGAGGGTGTVRRAAGACGRPRRTAPRPTLVARACGRRGPGPRPGRPAPVRSAPRSARRVRRADGARLDARPGRPGACAALVDGTAGDELTGRRVAGPPMTYQGATRAQTGRDALADSAFARTGEPVLTLIRRAPQLAEERGGCPRHLVMTAVAAGARREAIRRRRLPPSVRPEAIRRQQPRPAPLSMPGVEATMTARAVRRVPAGIRPLCPHRTTAGEAEHGRTPGRPRTDRPGTQG